MPHVSAVYHAAQAVYHYYCKQHRDLTIERITFSSIIRKERNRQIGICLVRLMIKCLWYLILYPKKRTAIQTVYGFSAF